MMQARSYFERALALDPNNIEVLAGMAFSDASIAAWFMTDDRASRLEMAEAALTRVLSLAPNHAMGHYLLGIIQISSNRAAQGIAECERALYRWIEIWLQLTDILAPRQIFHWS